MTIKGTLTPLTALQLEPTVDNMERVKVERQGVTITFAQACAIDRLCGRVHGQLQPFDYDILHGGPHNPLDVWIRVDMQDYLIGVNGAIAFIKQ